MLSYTDNNTLVNQPTLTLPLSPHLTLPLSPYQSHNLRDWMFHDVCDPFPRVDRPLRSVCQGRQLSRHGHHYR